MNANSCAPPPSFTIDTITEIKRDHPDWEIFYFIGSDNLPGLATWNRIDELRALVEFVVLDRGEAEDETAFRTIRRPIDISATEIRKRVADGRSIRYLVPPVVEEIIRRASPLPGHPQITSEELAKTCAELASNKKAEDIVVLDLREISTFTDFFVICSAASEPQLKAIAGEIEAQLKKDHGVRPTAVDGFPASQWIVLDYMQVIVHIFHAEKRDFYSLEDLWSDAPRLAWDKAA